MYDFDGKHSLPREARLAYLCVLGASLDLGSCRHWWDLQTHKVAHNPHHRHVIVPMRYRMTLAQMIHTECG